MEIPHALKDSIRDGTAILFLGAGASVGALNGKREGIPLAPALAKLIADKFLGGAKADKTLSQVAEFAIHETDFPHVQQYIASILGDYEPADFHCLIPTFKWKAIFTTNYDRIVELSYEKQGGKALQDVVPLFSNVDKIDEISRSQKNVPLVKLHGCITRTSDESTRMIITPDQYVTFSKGRENLYSYLKELGKSHPIVFIGYSMQDPDLRSILSELDELGLARPMYYIVTHGFDERDISLWAAKRITYLKSGFEEFLNALNTEVPENQRALMAQVTTEIIEHPIQAKFIHNDPLNKICKEFLENDAEYIHSNLPIKEELPKNFYRGFNLQWFPIIKHLDIKRDLEDAVLYEDILIAENERPTKVDFYVIKSHAGAGKSILLKRLAWISSTEAKLLCLHLNDKGRINYSALLEISKLSKERIFLFVDNIPDRPHEIKSLIEKARAEDIALTIIGTARVNEWSMRCEEMNSYVSKINQLHYLSHGEIIELLKKLEEHNSLGHLIELSPEKRMEAFSERAGRQLLVALHEATQGKPFRDIILDEYRNIIPSLAQSIYLTICTLNRFNIPVRAGLISRIYNVPFVEFRKTFFSPLEHVVRTEDSRLLGDYVYSSRHPEIASMVFEQALLTPEKKFGEYIKILGYLNTSFSTDLQSFRRLVRGKNLLEIFPEHTAVVEIFKLAHKIMPDDPYILQQHGIYEMSRPNHNLNNAHKYLTEAYELNRKDLTIAHSLAELAYNQSLATVEFVEKEKYRKEAESILVNLIEDESTRKYARHTFIKIEMSRLEEILSDDSSATLEIQKSIQAIEELISRGFLEEPQDVFLLKTEANFQELMKNKGKALSSLEKAFEINKRDPSIANRLAKYYRSIGDIDKAIEIIITALESSPNNQKLHYQLLLLYGEKGNWDIKVMTYHARRSFTPGDRSYHAQFLLGYYCYLSEEPELLSESLEIFRNLKSAYVPYEVKNKIYAFILTNNENKRFTGTLTKKEGNYGFITCDGRGDKIFVHNADFDGEWNDISVGKRLSFFVGFNFNGATATAVR